MNLAKNWLYLVLHNLVLADITEYPAPEESKNPIARHVAATVASTTATVVQLSAFETNDLDVHFVIQSLPSRGKVYETSQNYRSFGGLPVNAPTAIEERMLPFYITDVHGKLVYIPPSDLYAPEGAWGFLTYTAVEPVSKATSELATVVFANPDGQTSSSVFLTDCEGWSVSDNAAGNIVHRPFSWGALNRYCEAYDALLNVDFATSNDRILWKFQAPTVAHGAAEIDISEFQSVWRSEHTVGAYGGSLGFTIRAGYGNFTDLNDANPLQFVALSCGRCNSGRGLRLVRVADASLPWTGEEKTVRIPLLAGTSGSGGHWKKDPLNEALAFTDASACEVAAVLAGLSGFEILGDFTKVGEGVSLDDVYLEIAETQPALPVTCLTGCVCNHYPAVSSLWCCGYVAGA